MLDLGAGYGGAARYLAGTYGCHVTCLNLSEVENERNRQLNAEQGLSDHIDVVDGSFEDLTFQDNCFDVIWSQDALLHSGDRARVLEEAVRVLRQGGQMIFTDPMATEQADKEDLKPILQRIQLDTLATPAFYRRELYRLGVGSVDFHDHSDQLARHYQRVFDELERREPELEGQVSPEYRERMKKGLLHGWTAATRATWPGGSSTRATDPHTLVTVHTCWSRCTRRDMCATAMACPGLGPARPTFGREVGIRPCYGQHTRGRRWA